jgi:ClpP class serine protease
MFDRFKKVVMESRKLTDEQMDKVSDGSVVTAARALELGLIDQIGYFEDVEKLALQAEGPKCAVVRYTQPPSLADVLFSSRSPRLTALEGEIDTLTAMLRPGFYYLWPTRIWRTLAQKRHSARRPGPPRFIPPVTFSRRLSLYSTAKSASGPSSIGS